MISTLLVALLLFSTTSAPGEQGSSRAPSLCDQRELTLSRQDYARRLHGFWLGQSIANWTGLTTEMARVEPPFYTDDDWGAAADPSIWGHYPAHASRIDFFLPSPDQVWGADDDTDLEYLYQFLLERSESPVLTAEQIRDGWLKHIYSNEDAPLSPTSFVRENYLWVSNEKAYDLMRTEGLVPPATSDPARNELHSMIDAQLTTEIFGLLAPGRPDVAQRLAHLPIRTTARHEAAEIAEFYVVLHSLAACVPESWSGEEGVLWLADRARRQLEEGGYPAAMFDFVRSLYETHDRDDWEAARDAVYHRYQAASHDGYRYLQPFDAGINFAASLVSLFFGQGDLPRTIRIATLAGWDSDNPAATWGGLLGFLRGRDGVESSFPESRLPEAYWIHRTRRAFPDRTPDAPGEDTFSGLATRALVIIDRVVEQQIGGERAGPRGTWIIPVAPHAAALE